MGVHGWAIGSERRGEPLELLGVGVVLFFLLVSL